MLCPFDAWEPATLVFCEENLCGLISQPANAISSLAFCLTAFYLLYRVKIKLSEPRGIIVIAAFLLGITSFLYHATYTFFFQVFDVSSMFMLSCLLVVLNFYRLNFFHKSKIIPIYWASVGVSILAMLIFKGKIGETIFGAQIAIAVIQELFLFYKKQSPHYKIIFQTFLIYMAAFLFWHLDMTGIWCDPKNHYLQGHAVWHVLNAICVANLERYYRHYL
jgi:hypothetical protein